MPRYLPLDIGSLNPEDLRQEALDQMQAQAPAGWVPNPWLMWLLGAVARMAVLVLTLAGRVPLEIFKAFGEKVLRVPAVQATAATGTVAVSATAALGGTLPAGATIDIDGVAFQTTAPVVVASGATVNVAVQAVATGAAGSALAGSSLTLTSPSVLWVQALALTAPTIGGSDGETADEYVDRLPDEISTLSRKAILLEDVATIARTDAEVYRALPIRHYVPAGPGGTPAAQTNVEGAVTVAVMAADGSDVSPAATARVKAELEAETSRIVSITAYVINPTRTAVDIAFSYQALPDYDTDAVTADAKAAIAAALSPLLHGMPAGSDDTEWIDEPKIVRNDLFGDLYRVPGMRHVTALTLALHGDVKGTADLTLPGPAAVPSIDLADILVTVVP